MAGSPAQATDSAGRTRMRPMAMRRRMSAPAIVMRGVTAPGALEVPPARDWSADTLGQAPSALEMPPARSTQLAAGVPSAAHVPHHPAGHMGWYSGLPYGFTAPAMVIVPPPPEIADMAAAVAAAAAASVGLSPQALTIPGMGAAPAERAGLETGAPGGSPSHAGAARSLTSGAGGGDDTADDSDMHRTHDGTPGTGIPADPACDLGLAAVANAPVLLVPAGYRLARVDIGTGAEPSAAAAPVTQERSLSPASTASAPDAEPNLEAASALSPLEFSDDESAAQEPARPSWPGNWVGPLPMGDATPVFVCPAVASPVLLPAVVVCQSVLAGKCTVTPLRMPYQEVAGVSVPTARTDSAARVTGRVRRRADHAHHEEAPARATPESRQGRSKRARRRYA